jgi:hypothetical protein
MKQPPESFRPCTRALSRLLAALKAHTPGTTKDGWAVYFIIRGICAWADELSPEKKQSLLECVKRWNDGVP